MERNAPHSMIFYSTAELLIGAVLPPLGFLDARAICARDLHSREDRSVFARGLKTGDVALAAPRVYGHLPPIGQALRLTEIGPDMHLPSAFEVASALCRQNGWTFGIPPEIGQFVLSLSMRPTTIGRLPYNGDGVRTYGKVDLELYPAAPGFLNLSAAAQAIVAGLPAGVFGPRLAEIGEACAGGFMATPFLRAELQIDLDAGRLGDREAAVARAILKTPEPARASRRAPSDFVPPDEASMPLIESWWIAMAPPEFGGFEYLRAKRLINHPLLGSHGPLGSSSKLLWIDERIGYARTVSRVYKLGRKGNNSV